MPGSFSPPMHLKGDPDMHFDNVLFRMKLEKRWVWHRKIALSLLALEKNYAKHLPARN